VNVLLLAHLLPPLAAGQVFPALAALSFDALVSKAGSVLLVAIGIGLVIFFHELGHFAVAKWCDVNVERFSIGFGPILWSRKYGETEYAISAIPFGGYVKMLGQDDLDPSQLTSEELAKDPRSYMAKPVSRRMAIISAGVIMNILTGVMFYAIAFGHGIDTFPAEVGNVLAGFPAWQARLETGDQITSIAGRKTTTFEDINRAIALTSGSIEVSGTHADGKPFQVELTPNLSDGRRMIGVTPALSLNVIKKIKDSPEAAADPGSPAVEATPSFQPGDRVVGLDGQSVSNFPQLQRLLIEDRAKTVTFQVKRESDPDHPVDVHVPPQRFRQMGMTMDIGKITGIVKDSPAEKNGMQEGDKILRLNNRIVGKDIDPLRLPDELAALAGQEVTVVVQREMERADPKNVDIRLVPTNKPGWVECPMRPDSPMSAPAIGVAYSVIPTVLEVQPGSPADKAGVKKGDRIKLAELVLPPELAKERGSKEKIEVDFTAEKGSAKGGTWPHVVYVTQLAPECTVRLTFTDKDRSTVDLVPVVDAKTDWFMPGTRGLRLLQRTITLKSDGIADAAVMGVTHTKNSIIDLYLTLRNLFNRNLSAENVMGPLGIISVAYGVAQQGIPQMCLFLGILSANLAVLNFLPIPVLDGGHMVFLIWEAVTRKRPSERVQIAATYFGMAFVLCLAIFVFYLDIFVHFKVMG
jgi:regulator of sigma E protease